MWYKLTIALGHMTWHLPIQFDGALTLTVTHSLIEQACSGFRS